LKPPRAWYVLHTRSRFENVVHEGLTKKSLEAFLPKIQVPSRRRDRVAMIRVPLFPGYLFVKSAQDASEYFKILKTTGVVRFIGNRKGPLPVPDQAMESLIIMVSGTDAITTGKQFKKGDKVIVVNGPLTGVTGFFARYRGKGRVIVTIEALGQYAGVDVNEADVEILPEILS